MKRFYKDVTVGPASPADLCASEPRSGFVILLDGRPVRTPAKSLMAAPTRTLADAIAQEWHAQTGTVHPDTMPLTQILTTAIDRAAQRPDITTQALHYLDSDLLCYRASEPDHLVAAQNELWSPWLEWFEKKFQTKLETTLTLTRLDQPASAHEAVHRHVSMMNDHDFTAFHLAASVTGSIVLGLALVSGDITPETAWRCALCEELHYERTHDLERHGLDPIEEKRRDAMRRELDAAEKYFRSARI